MPNEYALVRKMRKGPKKVEPRDPLQGVTDPAILLKSDTQRIDKNVYTPEQAWDKTHTEEVKKI